MTRKRKLGAQIDLRRPREESEGLGPLLRAIYLTALTLLAAVAGASLIIEILTVARLSPPFACNSWVRSSQEGEQDTVIWEWKIREGRGFLETPKRPGVTLVSEPKIFAVQDSTATAVCLTRGERTAFYAALRESESTRLVAKRQVLFSREERLFAIAGASSRNFDYYTLPPIQTDSLREGETLADVLGRLPLAPALVPEVTRAFESYDSLPALEPGAQVRAWAVNADSSESPSCCEAVLVVEVLTDGDTISVYQGDSGWAVFSPISEALRRAEMRRPWDDIVLNVAERLALLFVVLVGMLAARGRTGGAAVRHFVVPCLLVGLFIVPAVIESLWKWVDPLAQSDPLSGWLSAGSVRFVPLIATGVMGLALLFLSSFLKLLHVMPSYESDLARRFRVPGRAMAALLLIVFVYLLYPAVRGEVSGPWFIPWFIGAMAIALLFFGMMLFLIVRILKLAGAQSRVERAMEETLQARMALVGVRLGFLLLTVAVLIELMPRGYTTRIPWTITLYNGMSLIQDVKGILGQLGLILPFLGFFLAIVRRGLWDVDLIIKRATVYSALTVLFVIAWVFLDVTVENLVPMGLFGIGLLNDLGATALAAGVVALSQRWVAGGITRRFFSESVDFDQAIEEISENIATADTESPPATYLGQRLTAVLGASPCAVLVRLGENLFRKVWSTGETAPVAAVAGAATTALETNSSAIVMTDEGPVLAARIGKGEQYPGLLLLGPRRGGRFYTSEERRLLTVLLNQAAMALRHERQPV